MSVDALVDAVARTVPPTPHARTEVLVAGLADLLRDVVGADANTATFYTLADDLRQARRALADAVAGPA